jgi:hypothetical protein
MDAEASARVQPRQRWQRCLIAVSATAAREVSAKAGSQAAGSHLVVQRSLAHVQAFCNFASS